MQIRTLSLVVGDWSCDGHEKHDTAIFETDMSDGDLKRVWDLAVQDLGFDFLTSFPSYDENILSEEQYNKLLEYCSINGEEGDHLYGFSPDAFVDTFRDIFNTAAQKHDIEGFLYRLEPEIEGNLLHKLYPEQKLGGVGYGLYY
jgi:hypothetical protein